MVLRRERGGRGDREGRRWATAGAGRQGSGARVLGCCLVSWRKQPSTVCEQDSPAVPHAHRPMAPPCGASSPAPPPPHCFMLASASAASSSSPSWAAGQEGSARVVPSWQGAQAPNGRWRSVARAAAPPCARHQRPGGSTSTSSCASDQHTFRKRQAQEAACPPTCRAPRLVGLDERGVAFVDDLKHGDKVTRRI